MAQKNSSPIPSSEERPAESTAKADIDRVLEIVRSLPMLRRYGDDGEAMKEAVAILEELREKL